MAYIGAFAVSMYAGTENRVSKPFNPILGETYEMIGERWKYICEQVSHHPPISAAYAESDLYEFWGNTAMKQSFKGTKLTFTPLGCMNIRFKDNDDQFIIKRPTTNVNNIILGTMYIDTIGSMVIMNLKTGESLNIKMTSAKGSGYISSSDHHEIKGKLIDGSLLVG